ncbi:hypothetical protein O6H91_21G063000 [Diphasiastrum complanatum]|uniref:Uncharacterized protein n=1 Tax=Diphasiastrum complanatum TaxID=34168 RepID=A0ACC2AL65_DIPCM|nr:hypothetical protein O6H91_21G063000 [Diphasiastrum complanatum]
MSLAFWIPSMDNSSMMSLRRILVLEAPPSSLGHCFVEGMSEITFRGELGVSRLSSLLSFRDDFSYSSLHFHESKVSLLLSIAVHIQKSDLRWFKSADCRLIDMLQPSSTVRTEKNQELELSAVLPASCETVAVLPAADSLAYACLRPVSACLWPTKLPVALYQPTYGSVPPAYLRPERPATWICNMFQPVCGQKQLECDLLPAKMRPTRKEKQALSLSAASQPSSLFLCLCYYFCSCHS